MVTLGFILLLPPSSPLWDHLSKANGYRVSESLARSHQGWNLCAPHLPVSLLTSPFLPQTSLPASAEWER